MIGRGLQLQLVKVHQLLLSLLVQPLLLQLLLLQLLLNLDQFGGPHDSWFS